MQGDCFVMHALGPENGELWIAENGSRMRLLPGVQNVPLYYVGVLRAGGIVYYVSSLEGAAALPSYPAMRPVAVGSAPGSEELHLGIHQSVLGQVGWRLDSRVEGVRVAELGGFDTWYAGAHAADRLDHPPVDKAPAELGLSWDVRSVARDADSVDAGPLTLALLDPRAPSGLVHVVGERRELASGTLSSCGVVLMNVTIGS